MMTRARDFFMIITLLAAAVEAEHETRQWDRERGTRRRRRREAMEVDVGVLVTDPDLFKDTFRVTPVLFDVILSKISHKLARHRQCLTPRLQLCMFLEHVGHGLSQRYLSGRYGVSGMAANSCMQRVCAALVALDLVKWPSLDEQIVVA